MWLTAALAAVLARGAAGPFPAAPDADAWGRLPRANPPLPPWARVLTGPLPKTAARMLALDDFHRDRSPLGAERSAAVRWATADALRSPFGKATAELDLRRAGVPADRAARIASADVPGDLRLLVAFARKLTLEGSAVTDEEFADLLKVLGPEQMTALVHTVAYANFHNRVVLGLGADGGATPPVNAAFDDEKLAAVPVPPRPPWDDLKNAPDGGISLRPEWRPADDAALRRTLEAQKERPYRIPPPPDERLAALPPDEREQAESIVWSRVSSGYQPEMPRYWFACLGAFYREAKVDRVFTNSLFWVITRTNDCFY